MIDYTLEPESDKRDTLYRQVQPHLEPFSFNRDVVTVFDDMIQRSVPFYPQIQDWIVAIAKRFYRPSSRIVDLGCSTGVTLYRLLTELSVSESDLMAVDYSSDMLEKAELRLKTAGFNPHLVTWLTHDLNTPLIIGSPAASVVILNLTLQFTRVENRLSVLTEIAAGLHSGGCLIYVEKCQGESSLLESVMETVYHDFKEAQGYSRLEIAQKKDALKSVLIPLSYSDHVELLTQAGFSEVDSVFRWSHFTVFLAIKS